MEIMSYSELHCEINNLLPQRGVYDFHRKFVLAPTCEHKAGCLNDRLHPYPKESTTVKPV